MNYKKINSPVKEIIVAFLLICFASLFLHQDNIDKDILSQIIWLDLNLVYILFFSRLFFSRLPICILEQLTIQDINFYLFFLKEVIKIWLCSALPLCITLSAFFLLLKSCGIHNAFLLLFSAAYSTFVISFVCALCSVLSDGFVCTIISTPICLPIFIIVKLFSLDFLIQFKHIVPILAFNAAIICITPLVAILLIKSRMEDS